MIEFCSSLTTQYLIKKTHDTLFKNFIFACYNLPFEIGLYFFFPKFSVESVFFYKINVFFKYLQVINFRKLRNLQF